MNSDMLSGLTKDDIEEIREHSRLGDPSARVVKGDRLYYRFGFHVMSPNENPQGIGDMWKLELPSTNEPYIRQRIKLSPARGWVPIDVGWVTDPAAVMIYPRKVHYDILPTAEKREEDNSARLLVAFDGREAHDPHPAHLKFHRGFPFIATFESKEWASIRINSNTELEVSIYVIPR